MGDIADVVKDILLSASGEGDAVVALDLAEAAVSTIANLSGALTALQAISSLQDLLGKSDTAKLQASVDAILSKFQELFELLSAGAEQNRNIAVTTLLGQSRAQLRPIRESKPPDFDGTRGEMLSVTSSVVEAFKQDSDFWKRLFLKEAVYQDDWVGDSLAPPQQGALVFDYLLMMPAFVESIRNRLCVLRAVFDDFPHHPGVPDELRDLANALQLFHDRVADGIVSERPPNSVREAIYDTVHDHHTSIWDDRGRTFGAVQIYSGVASIATYPRDRYPNIGNATNEPNNIVNNDKQYPVFLAKHALASLSRMIHVYSSIGMPSVWKMIVHLKTLAGDSLTPKNRLPELSYWSLVEANQLVRKNLAFGGIQIPVPPENTVGVLAGLLGFTRPVSIKRMLETNT
jgi:hypothetical protein